MSEVLPIVEQITRNLLAALAGVTTVSGSQHSLKVSRAKRTGDAADPGSLNGILMEQDPRLAEVQVLGRTQWVQPYSLLLRWFEKDASEYAGRAVLQAAWADVSRVLKADYTRGGLAINTIVPLPLWGGYAESNGGLELGTLLIDVHYRHLINDPFSQ